VPEDRVAVGCGSVSLCTQLVQAVADAGGEVVYAWRSFEAYPILTAISGATSVQVPVRDHVHDLSAMASAITGQTRLVFVCNPNNPTGTAVRPADLVDFLRRVPSDVVVARRGISRVRQRPVRAGRRHAAGRAPEPSRAALLLQGVRAGRAPGGVRDRRRLRGDQGTAADAGTVRGNDGGAAGRELPSILTAPLWGGSRVCCAHFTTGCSSVPALGHRRRSRA
jgi:hypothetical protein